MKNIRLLREQRNMTQVELADAVGISQKEISSYETGVKSPRVNVAVVIADVLGVTIAELVG